MWNYKVSVVRSPWISCRFTVRNFREYQLLPLLHLRHFRQHPDLLPYVAFSTISPSSGSLLSSESSSPIFAKAICMSAIRVSTDNGVQTMTLPCGSAKLWQFGTCGLSPTGSSRQSVRPTDRQLSLGYRTNEVKAQTNKKREKNQKTYRPRILHFHQSTDRHNTSWVAIMGCCFSRETAGEHLFWKMDGQPHAFGHFSMAMAQANTTLEDQAQVYTSPSATYIGVYDGHGGYEAARFVQSRLFHHIHKFGLERDGLSEDAISKGFDATEEDFIGLAKRTWVSKPQIASVGTCCLFGAIADGYLYVANSGDSRAVLGWRDAGHVVPERLTLDHNVGVEEVRKEVSEMHPDDSHIVIFNQGVWRIKGIIQVSRSIGDMYLKLPELCRDPVFRNAVCPVPIKRPVMTSKPCVQIRKLRPHDLFLIFASDGLWEQLSDEAAVQIVSRTPRKGVAKRLVKAAISEAARKREMRDGDMMKIEKGIRRHFHDDITVIVVFLDDHHNHRRPKPSNPTHLFNAPLDIFSLNNNQTKEEEEEEEEEHTGL